jgi:DNA-directed RNA polymerase alpha subunit/DNA-directed RNA polymerase subunit L
MSSYTNISITGVSEDGDNDILRFTLSNLNVSFANALRRIILSEIPINVIRTETEETNQCTITANTGRLHNEIIKQRLSCIPIHLTDLDLLPDKYELEVKVENTGENVMYVTTEQFRIKNKTTGNYLTREQTREIFPPNRKTNRYIDFLRLRPKIGDNIMGEKIELTAEFSVSNARTNSMFNVVSICTYANTPDLVRINEKWEEYKAELKETNEDIEFHKRNFYILDAQRYFVPNSYDYTIQSIGIYSNLEIVKKGCEVLANKFKKLVEEIDANTILVVNSSTTIDNCMDVILENEDYTVGKALEFVLYDKYFVNEKTLTYCGFKKFHPHDTKSVVRLAFATPTDRNEVLNILRVSAVECERVFEAINELF